jgi:hypothetical protein
MRDRPCASVVSSKCAHECGGERLKYFDAVDSNGTDAVLNVTQIQYMIAVRKVVHLQSIELVYIE